MYVLKESKGNNFMHKISCHVLLAVALSAAFPAQARNEGRPVPSGREPPHGIARARHGGPTLAVGAPFRRSVLPASLDGRLSVLLVSDAGDGVSPPMILPMAFSSAP